jgi:plasmid stabilization system protein ParE
MSGFRLAPEAEAELDDIWLYIARRSASIDSATRVVDNISEHFWLLAQHPYPGRRVTIGGPACAVFRWTTT